MKYLLLIVIGFLLFSCRTPKEMTNDTFQKKVETKSETSYKEKYLSLRDSIANIPAPKESSRTYGLMDSYLFTSLANSRAWLDETGNLNHTLQNNDSVPTKIIIKEIYITDLDSIYINKTDTLYITKHEKVIEELSFFDKIKIFVQDAIITLIIVAVVVAVYTVFIKRKG